MTYSCEKVSLNVRVYVSTCMWCVYVHICGCKHGHMCGVCACVRACMRACMCVHMHAFVCVYVYVYRLTGMHFTHFLLHPALMLDHFTASVHLFIL